MAKTCGAITLCDHSIAHPAVLSYMVDHAGQLPLPDKVGPVSRLELRMQEDLSKAEHVLVNSDFVKQTCVYAGMDADRIHVIYTGLEDKYLQGVPEFNRQQVEGRGSTVMYAGALQVRKGLWPLIEVFSGRAERPITIVGNAEPALREEERVVSFLASDNVNPVGILSRVQLAKLMTEHSIFVFPSLCEGSARVVFEAMACGCFIITTANSGSIVRDGVHGLVVPPGDASALAEAVDWANANPVRVAEIGWENAKLVRREYRQDHYVAKVMDLYGRLVAKQRALAVTV